MAKLGMFCFPGWGHLNPMLALGRGLSLRGHQVTVFGIADVQAAVRRAGLDFHPIGQREFPIGELEALDTRLSRLSGFGAFRLINDRVKATTRMLLSEAPAALRAEGVEAVVADEAEPAMGTVAEHLRIPFVTVSYAASVLTDPNFPPFAFGWSCGQDIFTQLRNQFGNLVWSLLSQPVFSIINRTRSQWGLASIPHPNTAYSNLAHLTQMPACLDFPRRRKPAHFHHLGPLIDRAARQSVPFPWDECDERPIVYASFGTLQNGSVRAFQIIAEACSTLNMQLILSTGGRSLDLGQLPGNPIMVEKAPQLEVLKRATLMITHAGLNSVLEALSEGVPLVAIPIAHDQPGVAARVCWHNAGMVIPFGKLSVAELRMAVRRVRSDPKFALAAKDLQKKLQLLSGVDRGSTLIEEAISQALAPVG
jgi:zeaxanthin glucosyltransferase